MTISRSRSQRRRRGSQTATRKSTDQKFHVEQLHRLLRDMEDDKIVIHNKHVQFQMKLDILKEIAGKHEYIREELRKGIIKPAPMKRMRSVITTRLRGLGKDPQRDTRR